MTDLSQINLPDAQLTSSSPSATVDLSIIIVNWNTRAVLELCLQSLYANPPKAYSFEVIVVDNASSDGTVEWLRQAFPQVRVVANEANLGYAKAVNQGYRISRGRFVMTLNPDAKIYSGSLDSALEFLEQNPDVAVVSPFIVGEDGRLYSTAFSKLSFTMTIYTLDNLMNLLHSLSLSKQRDSFPPSFSEFVATPYVFGPCLLCRREALKPDKIFEEATFLFHEENYLCEYIVQKGYKLGGLGRLRIGHVGGVSYTRTPEHAYTTRLEAIRGWYPIMAGKKGIFLTKLMALAQLIDAVLLWGFVRIKSFFYGITSARRVALALHKGRIVGFFWAIVSPTYLEHLSRKKIAQVLGGRLD